MNPIRNLELCVLRPVWLLVVAATVADGLQRRWGWMIAGLAICFWCGVIGVRLRSAALLLAVHLGPTAEENKAREFAVAFSLRLLTALFAVVASCLFIHFTDQPWPVAVAMGAQLAAIVYAVLRMCVSWNLRSAMAQWETIVQRGSG